MSVSKISKNAETYKVERGFPLKFTPRAILSDLMPCTDFNFLFKIIYFFIEV